MSCHKVVMRNQRNKACEVSIGHLEDCRHSVTVKCHGIIKYIFGLCRWVLVQSF